MYPLENPCCGRRDSYNKYRLTTETNNINDTTTNERRMDIVESLKRLGFKSAYESLRQYLINSEILKPGEDTYGIRREFHGA